MSDVSSTGFQNMRKKLDINFDETDKTGDDIRLPGQKSVTDIIADLVAAEKEKIFLTAMKDKVVDAVGVQMVGGLDRTRIVYHEVINNKLARKIVEFSEIYVDINVDGESSLNFNYKIYDWKEDGTVVERT